jgi:IS5 family transposase
MTDQLSLTSGTFERPHAPTRRELFLQQMESVVPWQELTTVIAPYYPAAGNGRPPIGLERMLRIYFLQQWFNLSDPAMEEAFYDSRTMTRFAGLDLTIELAPDETTICKFRHMIEEHSLGTSLFEQVNQYLRRKGIAVTKGTIVDATIIPASSSTKNQSKSLDPEMSSTKKGSQWYYGMKGHVGVDAKTKLIHHVVVTAAKVHDSQVIKDLLHGDETRVWGDKAYDGQTDAIHEKAPLARDWTLKKSYRNRKLTARQEQTNRIRSKTRARVEHVFGTMKHVFHFRRVRYKGLTKNANRFTVTCALVNLFTVRKHLLAIP